MYDIQRAKVVFQECLANPKGSLHMLRQEISNPDSVIRHVAAVQLIDHYPKEVPESVIAELLATLQKVSRASAGSDPLHDGYLEATASEDDWRDLGQDIAQAFAKLPANPASSAIVPLVQIWQESAGRSFYEAVLAAIALAFPVSAVPVSLSSLNTAQRSVLCALVSDQKRGILRRRVSDAIWTLCLNTDPMLVERGLPTSKATMQVFLRSAENVGS
jgi:hypothetical protein